MHSRPCSSPASSIQMRDSPSQPLTSLNGVPLLRRQAYFAPWHRLRPGCSQARLTRLSTLRRKSLRYLLLVGEPVQVVQCELVLPVQPPSSPPTSRFRVTVAPLISLHSQ